MAFTENDLWYTNIPPVVFTNLKVRMTNEIGADYPSLKFVSPNESYAESNYPTVWLRATDIRELSNGLDYANIAGYMVTVQVDVITLNSADSERIRNYATKILHTIGFKALSIPEIQRSGTKWFGFGRYRRVIEETDLKIIQ